MMCKANAMFRVCCASLLIGTCAVGAELIVDVGAEHTVLRTEPGRAIHSTANQVTDARLVRTTGSNIAIALWNEESGDGEAAPYYAISLDGDRFPIVRRTSYRLDLGAVVDDPKEAVPTLPPHLLAQPGARLFLIQFITQPLTHYFAGLERLGVKLLQPVNFHGYIVEMANTTRRQVEDLAFVRWVGPYHPGYRLAHDLLADINRLDTAWPQGRYNVVLTSTSPDTLKTVTERIRKIGGSSVTVPSPTTVVQASLAPPQLHEVLTWNEVLHVGRWLPGKLFTNNARAIGGADYLAGLPIPYTGEGVIGEVMDGHDPWLLSVTTDGNPDLPSSGTPHHAAGFPAPATVFFQHATNVFGILYATGAHAPAEAAGAKGMLAGNSGIYADICRLLENSGAPDCSPVPVNVNRRKHTCQLVTTNSDNCCEDIDPNCPYHAVFQTNSWGSALTTNYGALTRELDDLLFQFDMLVLHAQANEGSQVSGEQAWAKNVVSVGGVQHKDTLSKADDEWEVEPGDGASHGPAADGSFKPELTHFFDGIATTNFTSCNSRTFEQCCRTGLDNADWLCTFGGTSGATPIVAGHFGLFFQMWADDPEQDGKGLFGNVLADPACDPQAENCVFKNRPHMTTAKAMLINTAVPYDWNVDPSDPNSDLTRDKQGWGLPNVQNLYERRDTFSVVDETRPLTLGSAAQYNVLPVAGEGLRATLVYADLPGEADCGSDLCFPEPCPPCRVNDLTLKVIPPSGSGCYLGNYGLDTGLDSVMSPTSSCNVWDSPDADTSNTVENVFIASPQSGSWTIEVTAVEVNQDARLRYLNNDPSECMVRPEEECVLWSPQDVDFALVISGVNADCNGNGAADADDIAGGASADCNANGVPDECDVAEATSADCNANGVPDGCSGEPPRPAALEPDPTGIDKNRFISFAALTQYDGSETAIRVRLASLYHPPIIGGGQFDAFEGVVRWVGPPASYVDDAVPAMPNYLAAKLQCEPYFRNWSSVALTEIDPNADLSVVHIYGAEVMPSSVYDIQMVDSSCNTAEMLELESSYSDVLTVRTAKFGDVWEPFYDPNDQTMEPTFIDIGHVVDKFKSIPYDPVTPSGGPPEVRALLRNRIPPVFSSSKVSFIDVGYAVNGFKNRSFPLVADDPDGSAGPECCPGDPDSPCEQ